MQNSLGWWDVGIIWETGQLWWKKISLEAVSSSCVFSLRQTWAYPAGGPEAELVFDVGCLPSVPWEARRIRVPDVLNKSSHLIAFYWWRF